MEIQPVFIKEFCLILYILRQFILKKHSKIYFSLCFDFQRYKKLFVNKVTYRLKDESKKMKGAKQPNQWCGGGSFERISINEADKLIENGTYDPGKRLDSYLKYEWENTSSISKVKAMIKKRVRVLMHVLMQSWSMDRPFIFRMMI